MNIQRIWHHFVMTQGRVNRSFSRATLSVIERAIRASETAHMGEIRFVVEGALDTVPLFRCSAVSRHESVPLNCSQSFGYGTPSTTAAC